MMVKKILSEKYHCLKMFLSKIVNDPEKFLVWKKKKKIVKKNFSIKKKILSKQFFYLKTFLLQIKCEKKFWWKNLFLVRKYLFFDKKNFWVRKNFWSQKKFFIQKKFLVLCLEPFEKFPVGGWLRESLLFSLGPSWTIYYRNNYTCKRREV